MNAYRESAALAPIVEAQPRGLVRSNGSRCRCTAPGVLWCWWFDVREGDSWFCTHGAGWDRKSDPRYPVGYRMIWTAGQRQSVEPK